MSPTTLHSFFEELHKIADVDMTGLSPQTILNMKAPDPLETPGARKALDILDVAQARKTASVLSPAIALRASQKVGQPVLSRAKKLPAIKTQIRGQLIGQKGTLP